VRGPQGAQHQPGGDQHQNHPGDAEEPAEVEFETAEVQPHADPDRRQNSDGPAQHSEPTVAVRGLRGRQQEHRRFKAFGAVDDIHGFLQAKHRTPDQVRVLVDQGLRRH
jgi:hypothetical protein